MSQRKARFTRETKETRIEVGLDIDGAGKSEIKTGVGFLDHMLELFAKHGLFDLTISVPRSDLRIDEHHTVEDVGIALGQAWKQALGEKRGIRRYGFFILPMDEVLVRVAVDLGGRAWFSLKDGQGRELVFPREKAGDMATELVYDMLAAFTADLKANVHIVVESGRNTHHMIEGIFKCLARALRLASEFDTRSTDLVPSTKGTLID